MANNQDRLLRLKDIIGDREGGVPAIIPVSKTTWWDGVRSGRFPAPVRLLGLRITTWRAKDVFALVDILPVDGDRRTPAIPEVPNVATKD